MRPMWVDPVSLVVGVSFGILNAMLVGYWLGRYWFRGGDE